MDRTRVYVAGPLRDKDIAGYLRNCHRMIEVATQLRQLGFAPFTPCLDLLMGLHSGDMEHEDYFDVTVTWLPVAEVMFVIDDSEGVLQEIDIAEEHGVPVFRSIAAIVGWRNAEAGD